MMGLLGREVWYVRVIVSSDSVRVKGTLIRVKIAAYNALVSSSIPSLCTPR